MPVAVLVVCGAPLTGRLADMSSVMVDAGWRTHVIGTPSSSAWIDPRVAADMSIRFDFRGPHQEKKIQPDIVIVCPGTFNTINKVVAGLADNYAVSFICEAMGAGIPMVISPMVNNKLWAHLQWEASLDALRLAGVRLLDPQTGGIDVRPVQSGTGDTVVSYFQPSWLVAAAASMI